MTAPAQPRGELRLVSANLQFGGVAENGDDSAWCKSMACLLQWRPDVLLVQEMNGRPSYRLHEHLWRTANELGMTPVLGPPSPGSVSGNHPAVLVNTAAGLQILDAGPPPCPAGGVTPSWCEVQVKVPGMAHPVWFISVHLPARSATSQRIEAERLANLIAQRGGLAVAGGDWNGYAPADPMTPAALESLPVHLRPARMRPAADGCLEPDYRVHQALASVGLADAAAELAADRRTPPELTPTGVTGGARVDRFYLTSSLVPALERYEQAATGGSDHQALLLTLSTTAAADITAPPPLP
jgi:endonuclease/exonuclease/phosphatase family metal-dependent hydrolase